MDRKSVSNTGSGCVHDCSSCTQNYNSFLEGLPVEQRSILDSHRTQIAFKRGEYVYKEGMFVSGLFCLSKGKAALLQSDENGNALVTGLYKATTFMGLADYIGGHTYQTRCLALEDLRVCLVQKKYIDSFFEQNKVFAERLIKTLAREYRQANQRMLALTKKHMSARLAQALLELHAVFGTDSSGFIDVPLKRSFLAQLSNMNESNAIRHLSQFQKSGFVEVVNKKIQLTNMEALMRESQR